MHDGVDRLADVNVFRDIMFIETKILAPNQMRNIIDASGQEVVEANHLISQAQKAIT
jgi:hypothetical protein